MTAASPSVAAASAPNHLGRLKALTAVTAVAFLLGLGMALAYAGTDAIQGNVQRLFYFHMGAFFGAFVAFACTVVGGVQYLRTRNVKWDTFALAGVEVGVVLSFINLATGSIWARPIWNTWWTWDPRLTSAAVMVLVYIAYLMVRSGIENRDTRHRFAAVYGILAFSSVVFTLVVIRIRPDTIHPAVIGTGAQDAQGGFAMNSSMTTTLLLNMAVWVFLLTPTLMWWRIRLQNYADRVTQRKIAYMEQG